MFLGSGPSTNQQLYIQPYKSVFTHHHHHDHHHLQHLLNLKMHFPSPYLKHIEFEEKAWYARTNQTFQGSSVSELTQILQSIHLIVHKPIKVNQHSILYSKQDTYLCVKCPLHLHYTIPIFSKLHQVRS
jgi:hypothetical protein